MLTAEVYSRCCNYAVCGLRSMDESAEVKHFELVSLFLYASIGCIAFVLVCSNRDSAFRLHCKNALILNA